ncbi:hypothetical protein [Rummeliibacillus suwonensis]|uniref:hypothetical protein n=1 Tax=Rummeliibacillus suwonensis TaxID=1306154 RepID=UPI0011B5C6DC|nr:hypothetical protein [Rummeliibacillus suwonensis]
MKIYSLSGPSGTGKSTFALSFAHDHDIAGIIDDGLFIVNGKKIAGMSAKFEKSAYKAVKRAIFSDEDHAKEVQNAIKAQQIDKLLIIGTSDRMTDKIARRLEIGEIQYYYHIEDLKSSSELKLAKFIRKTEGKHIMPIPVIEVEQNFFKRFIQRGMEIFSTKKEKIGETTIVQPDFHQATGHIDKQYFSQMIQKTCEKEKMVEKVTKVQFVLLPAPKVSVSLILQGPIQLDQQLPIRELQENIRNAFDQEFELELQSIDINLVSIQ